MNVLFYFISLLVFNNSMASETRTWDGGGGDHLWTTAANWDNDTVPEFDADIIIALDDTVIVNVGSVNAESVTLSNGANLIVQSGASLSTSNGGLAGGDGIRLVGAVDTITTLTIHGTVNIIVGLTGSGDGLDINRYCDVLITANGHLNIANTTGDGIEVGGDLTNEGLITIIDPGGNGINSSGAVLGGNTLIHNIGQMTISQCAKDGVHLGIDVSFLNDGTLTVFDITEDVFASSSGKLTNNGTLHASGRVKSTHFIHGEGSTISIYDTDADLTFDQETDYRKVNMVFDINGPAASQYDQLIQDNGGLDLDTTVLQLNGTYVPTANDIFLIVEKKVGGAIDGTGIFLGLPEGSIMLFNGVQMYITYKAGNENDVALVVDNSLIVDGDNDGVVAAFDCNDNDPDIGPNQAEVPNNAVDENCDGIALVIDDDGDNFNSSLDCNDNDNTVYPGAPELCDGKDNDCNNLVDDGITFFTYYQDADGDGFGTPDVSEFTCQVTPSQGFVTNQNDCNDSDASIYDNAPELCDGKDNDCNDLIDDGLATDTYYLDADNDGYGNDVVSTTTCSMVPPDGYVSDNTDCDDTNPNVHPNANELCDGLDNDCDNSIDEDLATTTYYLDTDGDGYGISGTTIVSCSPTPDDGYADNSDDCNDNNPDINPGATEVANNDIDENCDGIVLEIDIDEDGFNSDEDCNDNNPDINPDATEIPNNDVDENCDSVVEVIDVDEDGFNSDDDCNDNNPDVNPDATEVPYNGLDDDCDPETVDDDLDGDGFVLADDCDDNNPDINTNATEIPNNDVDENCDSIVEIIDVDEDGFNSDDDCNDNNPDVNPDATEVPYNGLDDDCNLATVDDDLDGDGFVLADDCDDNNPDINTSATEIPNNDIDENCDGIAEIIDIDEDGSNSDDDCDDHNPDINPDATEIPYNGVDDDCNALTLDDDLDEDGFAQADDCDDNNADINPDATEVPYNGVDDDCNALTLDDDLDEDGFAMADDCDDNNEDINPNGTEIPNNNIDEDCDGSDLIVGLEQVEAWLVTVSPNPTNGLVRIASKQFVSADLIIADALGRELLRQPFAGDSNLDISKLPGGIYWLTILDEERIYQQKLIKE